ncbi:DUF4149 domain-containing protein [Marivibrio halodurans]|uniref:DUF4149 domain-containing protein n=1 Tax=Marivibrio halodurans TaxID=2039722 RepID=A0A8J7SHY4_9PROT|nr:DUF4149 domain-containing protein [Marivibrio halodurans]MBP5856733.1 DUF4149 domain-containing protein [Marivibrio halodurans]
MTIHLALASALFGAMLFFAAVVAPCVFRFLEGETAGRFLRGFFPIYYIAGLAVAGLGVPVAIWEGGFVGAGILAAVASGFALSRFVLVGRINAARDAELAGGAEGSGGKAAAKRFKWLHRASVMINLAQMVLLLLLILRALAVI